MMCPTLSCHLNFLNISWLVRALCLVLDLELVFNAPTQGQAKACFNFLIDVTNNLGQN